MGTTLRLLRRRSLRRTRTTRLARTTRLRVLARPHFTGYSVVMSCKCIRCIQQESYNGRMMKHHNTKGQDKR